MNDTAMVDDPVGGSGNEPFALCAARAPLFAGLDAAAMEELRFAVEPFAASAAQVLFRQGDLADGLYMLRDGEIRITRRLPGDREVELARIGPGGPIGEMALLDAGCRSATATTVHACAGYFISRERFAAVRAARSRGAALLLDRLLEEVCRRSDLLLHEIDALISARPQLAPAAPPPGAAATGPRPAASMPAWTQLARLPLFGEFPAGLLPQFVAPLPLRSLAKGDVLFRPGEPAQGCFAVVRGALALSVRQEAAGRQLQIAVLGPGQIAGQVAMIGSGRHSLLCAARERSLVLHVSPARFTTMRQEAGPAAAHFLDALAVSTVRLLRKANGHVARLCPERQATLAADIIASGIPARAEGP